MNYAVEMASGGLAQTHTHTHTLTDSKMVSTSALPFLIRKIG
jgi:hypothetical protein